MRQRSAIGDRGASRFGGTQPSPQVELHAAHPLLVALGVQPEPTIRAHRPHQSVAGLPGAQDVLADANAATQLADPQHARLRVHTNTLQTFDTTGLPTSDSAR